MEYRIFDDMTQCTEADVARLLPLVCAQRREKALRYKHLSGRWATLKAYELLGVPGPWQENAYGKPYLAEGPHFSLSHCKAGIAVVTSERPVGIDIEAIRPYKPALAEYVMNTDEMAEIATADDAAEAFTRLWTQKEAVLKLRGTGIVDRMQEVLTGAEKLTTIVCRERGYVVSIAEPAES